MTVDNVQPVEIRRAGPMEIIVAWSDGHESRYTGDLLRKNCPCADCDVQRTSSSKSKLRVLANPILEPVTIQQIGVVGTYAVNFEFSDGHTMGIYPYDLLRQICPCAQCQPT